MREFWEDLPRAMPYPGRCPGVIGLREPGWRSGCGQAFLLTQYLHDIEEMWPRRGTHQTESQCIKDTAQPQIPILYPLLNSRLQNSSMKGRETF
jgi:hypothetical protein